MIVLCAALLAVPLAAAGCVFAAMHANSEQAVSTVRHRLEPANDGTGHLATVVYGQSAAFHRLLLTGDPRRLAELDAAAAEAARTFSELSRLTAAAPGLHLEVARLEGTLSAWLGAVRPYGIVRAPSLPDPGDPMAVSSLDPQPILTATSRLADSIAQERSATEANASSGRKDMLVLVTILTTLLLALITGLVLLGSRRIVTPLAVLERRVREGASGALDGPPGAQPGWLREVSTGVEGIQARMKELRVASRQDREALTQNGEAVLGISEFLGSHAGPGPGVDAGGRLVAAEGLVAGDFLDIVALPDGTTALVQGDVSGHGVQAGLVGARVKSRTSTALRLGHDPQVAVTTAWGAIAEEDERFVTLVIVVLDPNAGTLAWVNAGHEPPLLRRSDATIEHLDATGPLVSSMIDPAELPWKSGRTRFAAGDLLVLATDGLTEARDAQGGEFGAARVGQALRAMTDTDPQSVITGLGVAADRHGIDWRRDDITTLAARITPGHEGTGRPVSPPGRPWAPTRSGSSAQ